MSTTQTDTDTNTYVSNPPISVPKQCAYTLQTALYWVGVFILLLSSFFASMMMLYIYNPRMYFTGYHPPIVKVVKAT